MKIRVIRKLRQDWKWFLISAFGLSTALACLIVIFLYVKNEFSYDRIHTKSDRIYRVTTDSNKGVISTHPARVDGDWPEKLMAEYPAIERTVRLVPYRNAIIRIGDQKFYSENAFMTDSSFFEVFDYKVLTGNRGKAFLKPGSAFIALSMAEKYFGHDDVIGREITIQHQQDPYPRTYMIEGVMEDFPFNSHFHAELLTSYGNSGDRTAWAYTYYLLKQGADADVLRNTIQQRWEAENQTDDPTRILYLQKLTDIHLFSNKTREIEANGNVRSVILLISGGLIILIVALINYFNLNRVQFISRLKTINVKIINGASKKTISWEIALESSIISIVSVVFAGIFISFLKGLPYISIPDSEMGSDVAVIILTFISIVALLSVLPFLNRRKISEISVCSPDRRQYSLPLVIQFTLAVAAIVSTIVLNRQMNQIMTRHPAAREDNMIVIADNPWEAVQRYQQLKNELLDNPLIIGMTSAMEEPGGDILDNVEFEMEGIDKNDNQSISIFTIDTNFFSFMGIEPLAGSVDPGYTPSHQWEADAVELSNLRTAPKPDRHKIEEYEKKTGDYREKYILNESALALLGISNIEDAVGKRFRVNFFLPDLFQEGEVVGVVPDFHYTNLHNEERPLVIISRKMFNYSFLIRISPEHPDRSLEAINEAWQKINPEFPFRYQFITDKYQHVYMVEYSQARVISLFALIALLLSALGIFAMAAFSIQNRVKEIGIRKVNGAKVSEILLMLNIHIIKWITISFIIAIPLSWYIMNKWLQNFAYKTELSWWIFAMAGFLTLGIALLTVSWQSWKAATRNPVEALRYE